jgi:hypothetical protein
LHTRKGPIDRHGVVGSSRARIASESIETERKG